MGERAELAIDGSRSWWSAPRVVGNLRTLWVKLNEQFVVVVAVWLSATKFVEGGKVNQ
jgi:hypothetical protein